MLIDTKDRYAYFTIIASAICFIIFMFMIRSVSVQTLGGMNTDLFKAIFFQTADMNLFESLGFVFSMISSVIVGLIFLTLGFAFLSSYGYLSENKFVSISVSIIAIISALVFMHFSLMSFFISIAFLVICFTIIPFSNTLGKELKRWVYFRTGSHSIRRAFTIFNILVVLGLFISFYTNIDYYQERFVNEMTETVQSMVGGIPLAQENINEIVSSSLQESKFFQIYLKWLPILLAFSVWVVLEFLSSLVFTNIGGLFTSLILRTKKRSARGRI